MTLHRELLLSHGYLKTLLLCRVQLAPTFGAHAEPQKESHGVNVSRLQSKNEKDNLNQAGEWNCDPMWCTQKCAQPQEGRMRHA